MKLCLDHHFPAAVAVQLLAQGHNVVSAREMGWHTASDDELLAQCTADGRTLMTNNVRDFVPIVQRWAVDGRPHAGLILTDDARWPRTADTTGRFVAALAPLLRLPDTQFVDHVHWL